MNVKLIKAYKETTFRLYLQHDYIDIRIESKNVKFKTWCTDNKIDSWAIITAENPYSKILSDDENSARNNELIQKIKFLNLNFRLVDGIPADSEWKPEKSFLVENILKSSALRLGNLFQQNAIVFGNSNLLPELLQCKI